MTFSLVARCRRTGQVGVGALTAEIGVGKLVAHAAPRTGAIASQASMNPYLGLDGLRLLADGRSAERALAELIAADPGRDVRQCGIVDARGGTAVWTGMRTLPWSGHLAGSQVMVQGNRLVGPQTLHAALEAFLRHDGDELAERLLSAVEAGEATGGDTEGARSATVYVMDTEEYPLWDVRVDGDEDPAARLRELYRKFAADLVPVIRGLPTRRDALGDAARHALDAG